MSDDGIRSFKTTLKTLKEESREERLGIAKAWDIYAKDNGLDYEYKHKRNNEVRIKWQCSVCRSASTQRI